MLGPISAAGRGTATSGSNLMGMRRRAATFVIGCASVALIAGCGDDAPIEPISTEGTTASGAAVSQEEFIVSADARCSEANAAIANLSTETGTSATSVGQELQITQGVLDGLQGIGEAEDPDGSLGDFYAALEEEIAVLENQQTALSGGDVAGADALDADLTAARTDVEDAALSYGFEDCGQAGSTLPSDPSTGTTPAAPVTPTTPAPATTTPVPTTPVPVTPTEPPVTPPSGGTGGGTATPPPAGGGGSSGSSGGISPG